MDSCRSPGRKWPVKTIEMTSATNETVQSDEATELSIRVQGISRRFGRRWALANVNLEVAKGRALMVAGHNGSGKSTLLRVIATALRANRGRVLVDGFDARLDLEEVRRRVALLGHFSNTYEAMSAFQNLSVVARLLGYTGSREEVIEILERVGLADRADDPISTFSAGMRKRVAIARLLLQVDGPAGCDENVTKAGIVLLDEPYGQLDPQGFRFVDDLILSLKERGTTLILATHLLDRGGWLCDEGMVLANGRVVWSGSSKDLRQESGLEPIRVPEEVN